MSQRERISKTESGSEIGTPGKILLIDDDEDITRVVAKILRKHEYEVATVNSGEAGIEAALRQLPDLVVCDLDMPGLDGFGVLARLRQDARLADIPVVFLTGQSA